MIQNNDAKAFIYRPEITFGDTNVVGNVYFANFVRWQGVCREMFLKQYCSDTIRQVAEGSLILHTSSVSCNFIDPKGVSIDDGVRIEMRLAQLRGGRLTMEFTYWADNPTREIANGTQKICSKKLSNGILHATVFPVQMLDALLKFAPSVEVQQNIRDAIEFQSTLPRQHNVTSV